MGKIAVFGLVLLVVGLVVTATAGLSRGASDVVATLDEKDAALDQTTDWFRAAREREGGLQERVAKQQKTIEQLTNQLAEIEQARAAAAVAGPIPTGRSPVFGSNEATTTAAVFLTGNCTIDAPALDAAARLIAGGHTRVVVKRVSRSTVQTAERTALIENACLDYVGAPWEVVRVHLERSCAAQRTMPPLALTRFQAKTKACRADGVDYRDLADRLRDDTGLARTLHIERSALFVDGKPLQLAPPSFREGPVDDAGTGAPVAEPLTRAAE